MNKQEAQEILNSELLTFRTREYEDLTVLSSAPFHYEIKGTSGAMYQIEVQAFWDNPRESTGDIRGIASIDDGRFPFCFIPLSADFIMSPGGNLVGE
jgi:hypothetical protein